MLDQAREQFVEDLRRSNPKWVVENVPAFAPEDYYDSSHLGESGQTKLADHIRLRVSSNPTRFSN